MRVVIIVCTYNEADSTPKMIAELAKVVRSIKEHELEVLYVDDSSPDGTAEIVRKHQSRYPWLHLIVNPKKNGLGAAYAVGMTYAMNQLKADYFIEFDADFQHPPSDIPRLVEQINRGYDYVIASRYIKGGSIPAQWEFSRKFLSVVGNLVARTLLILPKIHDVTGGFKLSKVKGFMDQFDFSTLYSKRFAYKVHLLHFMVSRGAKVKEVPFAFSPRNAGESKIIKNELQETLRVIFLVQLHNPHLRRFFKFGVVGGIGLAIQTSIFEITSVFNNYLSHSTATVVGAEAAIVSNFLLNNLWTFKDHTVKGLKLLGKFVQFNVTSLLAITIQFVVVKFGEIVSDGNNLVIQFFFFGALIIVIITNYYIYNKFIWKTGKKASSQAH